MTLINSKAKSNSPAVKPRASFNPKHFVYSPDILESLTGDLDPYTGTENFTIYGVPSYVRGSIERCQIQSKLSMNLESPRQRKPGIGATTTLIITHGLTSLSAHPSFKSAVSLRESIAVSPDGFGFDEVYSWMSQFPLNLADVSSTKTGQFNIFTTPQLKSQVSAAASDLGLSASSIALLSIYFALSTQPPEAVLSSHRDFMQESVNLFLRRLDIRVRMGKVLLDALDEWRQDQTGR